MTAGQAFFILAKEQSMSQPTTDTLKLATGHWPVTDLTCLTPTACRTFWQNIDTGVVETGGPLPMLS
jgi:hypothetical protein